MVVEGGRLVGADPFTLFHVTAVYAGDVLELVRDSDGATWSAVPGEYALRV